MLRDSKSTVSVIALLASLFSAPVCAQQVAAASPNSPENVETVVVTGSRVITDIANSPTPVTAVSCRSAADHNPDKFFGRPEQAADFPEQLVEP